jgi:predicted PurR-regulated permease PerM
MRGLRRTIFSEIKQVLWALFLVYLILFSLYLFIEKTGYEHSLEVVLAVALFVTLVFITLYIFNIVCISIERRIEERLNRPGRKP